MRRILLGAFTVTALAAAGAAQAQSTTTGSLTVQGTVVNNCTIDNTPTLDFGSTVDTIAGVTTRPSANILVTCTLGHTFAVGLGDGANASGGNRRMVGGTNGDFLTYNLDKASTGTARFGNAVVGERVTGTGNGSSADSIPVYGYIPAGQAARADTYSDTVTITVHF